MDLLDDIVIVPGKPVVVFSDPPRSMPTRSQRAAFIAKDPSDWTWSDLRDYVIAEIEKRQGVQERDVRKEGGIFKSFLSRWGADAPRIAQTVFDFYDGMWNGQPVTVTRFCKGSDPYFSEVIAARF